MDEEEAEIIMAIGLATVERPDLTIALQRVRMRKEMRPSRRVGGEPGARWGGADADAFLPAYVERAP